MYLSSLFCFFPEILGCCASSSSLYFRRFSSFSNLETGASSATLVSCWGMGLVSFSLFLCFRCLGTNFGILAGAEKPKCVLHDCDLMRFEKFIELAVLPQGGEVAAHLPRSNASV